jgi:hypothetical protein
MRLADVSLLARDVHSVYLKSCCANSQPVIPVRLLNDGLIPVIEKRTGINIEIECLPWSENMIRANLRRYGNHAVILYSHELNVCWGRFCICKEAYHLLSNDTKTFSTDPVSLVTGLLNDVPVLKIDEDVEAEWMAVFGAMELLVPASSDDRLYHLESLGTDHYDIALEFRVPEKIISLRLSPNVRTQLDLLHKEMR